MTLLWAIRSSNICSEEWLAPVPWISRAATIVYSVNISENNIQDLPRTNKLTIHLAFRNNGE
jgi:hypothetical protein